MEVAVSQNILDLIVDIFTSLFLAGIAFVLGLLYRNIRNYLKFNEFSDAFGQVAKEQDNIILSIPLWYLKGASRDATRFRKQLFDGQSEEYFGPDETVSFKDLKACVHIVSIISEFYSKPIEYTLDNEQIQLKDKTVIMIGAPLANLRARSVFELEPDVCFDYVEEKETVEHPAATAIRDKIENKTYSCAGDLEYSMVMRIPNRLAEDGYLFFVSGAHASGTLAAAIHLKNHWKRFKDSEKIAGFLLEMPYGDWTSYKIVKEYGLKPHKGIIQNKETVL